MLRYYCIWTLICLAIQSADNRCNGLGNIFKRRQRNRQPLVDLEYDLVIIGAGASGMFASGASTMLGTKTLLIDTYVGGTSNVGGDCTNSACVPSKAMRSMAQRATALGISGADAMLSARQHATRVVNTVRERESPRAIVERNPMLDLILVDKCFFQSPNLLTLGACESFSSSKDIPSGKNVTIYSKKFLIATGASPVVPTHLDEAARRSGILAYTYRTLLHPSEHENNMESLWQFQNDDSSSSRQKKKTIIIAGGGATACELGQTLSRLGKHETKIHLVAPTLLRGEDVSLQNAAAQLLSQDGVELHLRNKVEDILANKQAKLSDGTLLPPADAIVFCLGRKPSSSLSTLQLERANVEWTEDLGILVNKNLRSQSARNVFACGDCCSAVSSKPRSRTATHGAWTGYHAAINTIIPRIFRVGSKSVHPVVPRVVYTDPELATVGMSLEECIRKFGTQGFDRLYVPELQTDRADMDSKLRNTIGFVEIRSAKVTGKILGFSCCGPAASELANEMSLSIQNKLTVFDVATSLHSYPSHGYLMHRVALALALSNVWGQIEVLGYVGVFVAACGKLVSRICTPVLRLKANQKDSKWEATGARESLLFKDTPQQDNMQGLHNSTKNEIKLQSYMEVYNNLTVKESSKFTDNPTILAADKSDIESFKSWLSSSPRPSASLRLD